MADRPARTVVVVGGVVAVLVGLVWVGQGLGYLPGSGMTGVRMWFWIGIATVLVGLALLRAGVRRRRPTRRP